MVKVTCQLEDYSSPAMPCIKVHNNWISKRQGTLWIEYGGERMQLSYWADRLGIPYHTLYDRLHRYGWSVERAFTEPIRRAL